MNGVCLKTRTWRCSDVELLRGPGVFEISARDKKIDCLFKM